MPPLPPVNIASNAASAVGPQSFGSLYGGNIGMVQTPTEVELAFLNAGKQAPASTGFPRWAFIAVPIVLLLGLILLVWKSVKKKGA